MVKMNLERLFCGYLSGGNADQSTGRSTSLGVLNLGNPKFPCYFTNVKIEYYLLHSCNDWFCGCFELKTVSVSCKEE